MKRLLFLFLFTLQVFNNYSMKHEFKETNNIDDKNFSLNCGFANFLNAKKMIDELDECHKKIIVNSVDSIGKTPLIRTGNHYNVYKKDDHAAITKLLIDNGANVNYQDFNGRTALNWAVSNNAISVVQELLKSDDININLMGEKKHKRTPLFIAVWKDNVEIIKLLLKKNADTNITNFGNTTPLVQAIYNNNLKVVCLLLENGADPKLTFPGKASPLAVAMSKDRKDIILAILEKIDVGDNIINLSDRFGTTILMWSAKNGYIDIVKKLIEKGVNIKQKDRNQRSALFWACSERGRSEIVNYLLSNGALSGIDDVDYSGSTALCWACSSGKAAIVYTLLRYNASIEKHDNQNMTPLIKSIQSGDKDTVHAIITGLIDNKAFNSFKVVGMYKKRNCFSWLLRMHPLAPKKNLNLYSKKDFDDIFKLLVTPELLSNIDILHKDSYGCNVVYWLSVVGEHKNMKLLFDGLRNIKDGYSKIEILLNNRCTDDCLTALEKVDIMIDNMHTLFCKKNPEVECSGIHCSERFRDLWETKVLISSYLC